MGGDAPVAMPFTRYLPHQGDLPPRRRHQHGSSPLQLPPKRRRHAQLPTRQPPPHVRLHALRRPDQLPTFDVISRARQQAAQHHWRDSDIVTKATPYLPAITLAVNHAPPSQLHFTQANLDSMNHSVINPDGTRQPPPYRHHIDDALYGDIAELVPRGLAASKLGLYTVLGYPDHRQPDPFSDEKCNSTYTHIRRALGKTIDTRSMTISLPADDDLDKWAKATTFTLLEACSIYGSIISICDIAIWGKPYLFTVQNQIARAIQAAHWSLKTRRRLQHYEAEYIAKLSPSLMRRLQPLVARNIARDIFNSRTHIRITGQVSQHFLALADYLRDPSNPWESPISHLIPRDPFVDTRSDASEEGIGFTATP